VLPTCKLQVIAAPSNLFQPELSSYFARWFFTSVVLFSPRRWEADNETETENEAGAGRRKVRPLRHLQQRQRQQEGGSQSCSSASAANRIEKEDLKVRQILFCLCVFDSVWQKTRPFWTSSRGENGVRIQPFYFFCIWLHFPNPYLPIRPCHLPKHSLKLLSSRWHQRWLILTLDVVLFLSNP